MRRTTTGESWQKFGDIAARVVEQARRLIEDTQGAVAGENWPDQQAMVRPISQVRYLAAPSPTHLSSEPALRSPLSQAMRGGATAGGDPCGSALTSPDRDGDAVATEAPAMWQCGEAN
jgi:hypothetical protein